MINLIGTYECKSDAKGRIMLPSALKKTINANNARWFCDKKECF